MCDVALISVTAIFGESSLLGLKQSITSPTKIPLSKTTASPGSIYIWQLVLLETFFKKYFNSLSW